MENVEVVVQPPDVCYLYPPYDHTSSSLFTVRARSKSNPVAYKILFLKNKRMRVCVEERIQYEHFPADRGVIKPGTTKVFKAILAPGYDPVENKDDGFNILFVLTSAHNALADDWWKDENRQVARVDFLMMGDRGRCLPENMVETPTGAQHDPSIPHPGRTISFDGDNSLDGTWAATTARAAWFPDAVSQAAVEAELVALAAVENVTSGGDAKKEKETPTTEAQETYDPQAEAKLLEDLIKSLKEEQNKVEHLFQSAMGALERAEKFHKGEM